MGGRRENMSNARRKELAGAGRGAVGKTAVVGVRDRATKQIAARMVEHTDAPLSSAGCAASGSDTEN